MSNEALSDILFEFESKYPDEVFFETSLNWDDFEDWRFRICKIVPTPTNTESIPIMKQLREYVETALVGVNCFAVNFGRERQGANYYSFAAYCCSNLLCAQPIKNPLKLIDCLNAIAKKTTIDPLKATANETFKQIVVQNLEELKVEVADEFNLGRLNHLSLIQEYDLVDQKFLDALKPELTLACSLADALKPPHPFLSTNPNPSEEACLSMIKSHFETAFSPYDFCHQIASEILKENLDPVFSLTERRFLPKSTFSKIVLQALLDHINDKWLPILQGRGNIEYNPPSYYSNRYGSEYILLRDVRRCCAYLSKPELEVYRENISRLLIMLLKSVVKKGSVGTKEIILALAHTCELSQLPYLQWAIGKSGVKHSKTSKNGSKDTYATQCSPYIERFGRYAYDTCAQMYKEFSNIAAFSELASRERISKINDIVPLFRKVLDIGGLGIILNYSVIYSDKQKVLDTLIFLISQYGRDYLEKDKEKIEVNNLEESARNVLTLSLSYSKNKSPLLKSEIGYCNSDEKQEEDCRTIFDDHSTEQEILHVLSGVDERASRIVECDTSSHEERLTGFLLAELVQCRRKLNNIIENWARARDIKSANICINHKDLSANRGERIWGADIGFHLSLDVQGQLKRRRGIIVQVKKPNIQRNTTVESSWTIDPIQRDLLIGTTQSSYYLLLGLWSTGTKIRLLPSRSVRELMNSRRLRQTLPFQLMIKEAMLIEDFLLYEFIGGWAGDDEKGILDIVANNNDHFSIRNLVDINISIGKEG